MTVGRKEVIAESPLFFFFKKHKDNNQISFKETVSKSIFILSFSLCMQMLVYYFTLSTWG